MNRKGKSGKKIVRIFSVIMSVLVLGSFAGCGKETTEQDTTKSAEKETKMNQMGKLDDYEVNDNNGNVLIFNSDEQQVTVELCTSRTVRVALSLEGDEGYRPQDPEYYMVQKNDWAPVEKKITEDKEKISVFTDAMEIRIQKNPLRVGMYDLDGNLLSKDTDEQGMYWNDEGARGVKKEEGTKNAGGIFGFGSGDHGRREELNRYENNFHEFAMSHGRLIAPFFMSTVGYGIFLNTMEDSTAFFKQGGGFQTVDYLEYYFMYGPDFKTILNEYAETGGVRWNIWSR